MPELVSTSPKVPPQKVEVLPRGVHRRNGSITIYLTHPGGKPERRSLENVSVKFAEQQHAIWQREINEGRYLKPPPRVEPALFSKIADKEVEYRKNYTRCWDGDESRVKVLKRWFAGRTAQNITTAEIEAKLLEHTEPRGTLSQSSAGKSRSIRYPK
jgi:hypothetical protein